MLSDTSVNFKGNRPPHLEGMTPTVLVVEDSDDARYVLSLLLRQRGCHVITAANGGDAVETALSGLPDLILMDLNLPEMDGLAATERIREHGELNEVPIIAVTAYDTYGMREAALEAGCQDYLLKPVDWRLLNGVLRSTLPGFALDYGDPAPLTDVPS